MSCSSSAWVATHGVSNDEVGRYGGHYLSEWDNSLIGLRPDGIQLNAMKVAHI